MDPFSWSNTSTLRPHVRIVSRFGWAHIAVGSTVAAVLAGRPALSPAAEPAPAAHLGASYFFRSTRPLAPAEGIYRKFLNPLPVRIEWRDGIVYRDGRPYFLVGSQIGAGQWNQKLMFLPRLMGDNYATISVGTNRHFYTRFRAGKLELAWERIPFVKSMANEAARNRMLVYLDLGGGRAKNMAMVVRRLREHKLAGAQDWLDQCNAYYGHYYPIDVNSVLGQQFYLDAFAACLRYFTGGDVAPLGVELRNELAVYAFTPQALEGFRRYLRTKYGDVEKLNRVCGTRFPSLDRAVPAFLLDRKFLAQAREDPFHQVWSLWVRTIAEAKKQYPELSNDWIEFTRGDFAAGFERLVAEVRRQYGNPFPLTLQTRLERVVSDGYRTIDIERIAPCLDFWGQQISNVLFYHYNGRPADPDTVKEAMNRLTLYPDFGRGICSKPIVNTECIVEGSFPAERNLDHMLERAIVKLHTMWKYRADAESAGEKSGWAQPDFDDSEWPAVKVPNLRRDSPARRFRGRVWYRFSFPMDARYQRLRDFDFKRFVLYVARLVPGGRVYFNGDLVCVRRDREGEFIVDLSDRLNYGGKNTLAVAIDNPRGWGGIDGPIALVDADDLRVKRAVDAGQTAALFWQQAVHGFSGVNFWQVKQPAINPEIVRTRLAIESVAEVLLPRPRIRGKVAVLYPFESFGGIVRHLDDLPEFSQFMNVYAGLLFHHVPVDVLSCRGILEGRHNQYRLLVLPLARLVRAGVFKRVLEYVEQGGTVLLTPDSLIRDDRFYRPLPLERLIGKEAAAAARRGKAGPTNLTRRIGRGRVRYIADVSDFHRVYAALGDMLLGEADVAGPANVAFDESEEFPFVELQVINRPPRFLVYLMNWGGVEHRGRLRLRPEFLGRGARAYRVRDVRRRKTLGEKQFKTETLEAGIEVTVPPQTPVVLLFEAADRPPLRLKRPAPRRMAVIRRLAQLRKPRAFDPARPSVLILKARGEMQGEHGKAGCPVLVDLLEGADCRVYERFVSELSSRDLRRFDLVFIQEDYQGMWKQIQTMRPEFWDLLRQFLEAGGSLFVAGTVHAGWNAASFALNGILNPYGISTPKRYPRDRTVWLADPRRCIRSDPLDVVLTDVRAHPTTRGVHNVQLHCATPILDRDRRLTPLVLSTKSDPNFPSQSVICAGAIGKGRLVVSGEPYFLQPFRIEQGDNLVLAWNLCRWLLRDRLPARTAQELRKRLLFREAEVLQWERDEQQRTGRREH
ncbi:MAG: hypothetical protein GXP31_00925 [Kiritimatiellaeota bacterium]|nr:hypothetical protein [Kiritimatiellota bacterium]